MENELKVGDIVVLKTPPFTNQKGVITEVITDKKGRSGYMVKLSKSGSHVFLKKEISDDCSKND